MAFFLDIAKEGSSQMGVIVMEKRILLMLSMLISACSVALVALVYHSSRESWALSSLYAFVTVWAVTLSGYLGLPCLSLRPIPLKKVEEEDRWQEEFSRLLHEDMNDDDDEEVKVLVRRILPH